MQQEHWIYNTGWFAIIKTICIASGEANGECQVICAWPEGSTEGNITVS